MSEGELLLAKYNQLSQLGKGYVKLFKSSIGPAKWELIKAAQREAKTNERQESNEKLREERKALKDADDLNKRLKAASDRVARLRGTGANAPVLKLEADPVRQGKWRQSLDKKQERTPKAEPSDYLQSKPTYTTSVNASGQTILHLDRQTKIILKPGHDPEQVFQKYSSRNNHIEKMN